jgi:molybdenum cofactor synthesis domain-containing protein
MRISIGVLTVRGEREGDTDEVVTSAALRALAQAGYESITTQIVDPEAQKLQDALLELCESCEVVLTAGGCGFGTHDVLPEVTAALVDRVAPGLVEHIRYELGKHSETSYLHRGVAGIRGKTVIINLPSSAEMVKNSIETVSLLLRPMMSDVRDSEPVGH